MDVCEGVSGLCVYVDVRVCVSGWVCVFVWVCVGVWLCVCGCVCKSVGFVSLRVSGCV
jgi:hypothetical protein